MQRLAEYLENAQEFEQLAAEETTPRSKSGSKQLKAAASRRLAEIPTAFLRALELEPSEV